MKCSQCGGEFPREELRDFYGESLEDVTLICKECVSKLEKTGDILPGIDNPRIDNLIDQIKAIEQELKEWIRQNGGTKASSLTGISKAYFSNYLKGKEHPSYEKMLQIAKILL